MSIDAKIERFAKLKQQFPDKEMPRWSLAQALEEGERFEEAIAEYRDLVAMKPDYCVAFLQLGKCLIEVDEPEQAIEALEEAMRLAVAQGHAQPQQQAEALLEMARDEL